MVDGGLDRQAQKGKGLAVFQDSCHIGVEHGNGKQQGDKEIRMPLPGCCDSQEKGEKIKEAVRHGIKYHINPACFPEKIKADQQDQDTFNDTGSSEVLYDGDKDPGNLVDNGLSLLFLGHVIHPLWYCNWHVDRARKSS